LLGLNSFPAVAPVKGWCVTLAGQWSESKRFAIEEVDEEAHVITLHCAGKPMDSGALLTC
jgi:hypothetical protein